MNEKQYYTDIISGLAERTIKRLWIIIILLIIFFVGSNCAWLWYEKQWEVTETTVTQEAIAGEDNDIRLIGGDFYGSTSEADG